MGDRYLAATDVLALAKMPTKQVLQASLVGTLAAPMTGVVGVLNQKLASLLYVLKAIQDKKS
jgi:ribosomal protein L10